MKALRQLHRLGKDSGFLFQYILRKGAQRIHPRQLRSVELRAAKFSRLAMPEVQEEMPTFQYPEARRDESIVDEFHGVKVSDPYRWLEDPDSEETKAYVEKQNQISQPFLERCPEWKKLNENLTKRWNYPKYSCPFKNGDRYVFFKNTGLQNQDVLYIQDSLDAEPRVFLDPNALSSDGTIALVGTRFSEDGNLFTYGLSQSGSDWAKLKVRDVNTGEDFPETLEHTKFVTASWTKDNKGFFYSRYPVVEGKADGSETAANENQKLYYHRVGEGQDKDVLIADFPEEPSWRLSPEVSDCGKYLVLFIMKGCKDMLLYFSKLGKSEDITGKLDFVKVVTEFDSDYDYITNEGSIFTFRTNKNAPNYRLVNIDFDNPAFEHWKTLVPEHEKNVLEWSHCVNQDKVVLGYLDDVKSVVQVHNLTDGSFASKFPLEIGSILGFSGKKKYSEIFFHFVSFLTPGIIYHYDFAKDNAEPTIFREVQVEGFDSSLYKVEQVFYKSKDDERIPMFIVQKKAEKQEHKPCFLYGYGGFNISIHPSFNITGIVFVDSFDGILAYPNIRGGGEYGERWHNGGRLLQKQNVFDDFQYAAQYLVESGYTRHNQIVIQGGSNGGLLVGACINQRPDLFGAAVAQVGVMDMLRFHKFTIGQAWVTDYGDIGEKEHFENLYKYSPLHNVRAPKAESEQYPATLVLTADHDDRVSPLHSLKFVAALHHAVKGCPYQKNPLLLRVYSKAGHGLGKPTTKKIDEATDVLTFMYKTLKFKLNC
ncbi:prolyl endopeptidase-like isoform X2 [Toxorhynchites rutilus septentrionalis]|uniref:prolyl endopeptidase-like isoform X2 n=1 Tax=Toxorhynchites rutilus septentrionalis TaxID=329112 RepID=UPI002478D680|nr:prolyl endopeptidase-like isoform X2 [Toxorhynchites rutilus septentrionalis]